MNYHQRLRHESSNKSATAVEICETCTIIAAASDVVLYAIHKSHYNNLLQGNLIATVGRVHSQRNKWRTSRLQKSLLISHPKPNGANNGNIAHLMNAFGATKSSADNNHAAKNLNATPRTAIMRNNPVTRRPQTAPASGKTCALSSNMQHRARPSSSKTHQHETPSKNSFQIDAEGKQNLRLSRRFEFATRQMPQRPKTTKVMPAYRFPWRNLEAFEFSPEHFAVCAG
jgi:hypothetical protein